MADEGDEMDDATVDMGEPIEELRLFEEAPSPGFLGRLLGALRRKDLSSQLATLSWTGFGVVVLEYLKMLFSIFETDPGDRGGSS